MKMSQITEINTNVRACQNTSKSPFFGRRERTGLWQVFGSSFSL